MKKLLLLTISLFISIQFIFAQTNSGGPDSFGYTYRTSNHPNGPTYQWFDISQIGSNVLGLSDDNYVGPYSISGFPFYTSTPSVFYIGSNGYIAFSPTNIASSGGQFPAIPLSSSPNGYIAPLLTDLNCGGVNNASIIYYYNQGDTVCVSFEKIPFWYNNSSQFSGSNSFQVIFNKADSSITFNYKNQTGAPDPSYTMNALTIGIENQSGTDGLQYYRGMTFPSTNFSIKFYYPSTVPPISDLELNWIDNEKNGGIFINSASSYSPVVNIKNSGNQAITDSIKVICTIRDSMNQILLIDSAKVDSLPLSSDSSKVIPLNFTPPYEGKFKLTAEVSGLNNEAIVSNNTKDILIISKDATRSFLRLVYTNDTSSIGGISWLGGNGGVGVYFEAPFHPFKIETTGFFIPNIGSASGFHSMIYDDNARGGNAGTLLDSSYIPNFQIMQMAYTVDTVSSPIIVNSGGVYLLWLMDGNGISLGRSFTASMAPSLRTYEVIGGSWAEYRDNTTQEFMMYIEVSNPLITSIHESGISTNNFTIYPNPANEYAIINTNDKVDLENIHLFNSNGQLVNAKFTKTDQGVKLLRGTLSRGAYYIQINNKIGKVIFNN